MFVISLIIVNIIFVFFIWVYNRLTISICKCSRHLVGKVVIVTGSDSGIGFQTAKDMAERGARVILACLYEDQAIQARDRITAVTGNQDVHVRLVNLASLASIRKFADNILQTEKRLDILINNAGVCCFPKEKTEDGLLNEMQINYFGPFLLTCLLLPLLKSSAPSRIVNVSSVALQRGKLDIEDLNMEQVSENLYNRFQAYANSKLCIFMFTCELSRRLVNTGVTVNCLHPGFFGTNIAMHMNIPLLKYFTPLERLVKTPWEGAQTSIYLAVSPDAKNVSGNYFRDCRMATLKSEEDTELARKLYEKTEQFVQLE